MLPAFKRVFPPDYTTQAMESNVDQALAPVLASLIIDGRLLTAAVGASPLVLNHALGRQPQGWIVVDISAAASVWRTAWSPTTLTLLASAPANISLWVF